MTDTTRAWLAEVRERCEKAMPCGMCDGTGQINFQHPLKAAGVVVTSLPCDSGAHDVPRLLALIERLRGYATHRKSCIFWRVESPSTDCDCGFERMWEGHE